MIKAILSDSDGTLVNTVYLIRHGQYEAAATYLSAQGVPRHHIPSYKEYEKHLNQAVGGNTRETFEKTLRLLFTGAHERYLEKIDFEALTASLEPIQDRIAPLYVHPFPGLTEFFLWMGNRGINLGIFSSGTPRHIFRNIGISLPALGYTELFRLEEISPGVRLQSFINRTKAVFAIPEFVVVSCEDVTKTKPDPEGILQLMERLSLTPEEVLVMGDHPADIQAAHAAGLSAIGVSHGFGSTAELQNAGALQVFASLQEVTTFIDSHNNNRLL